MIRDRGSFSVASVIVYDRELSLPEVEAVEEYLSATYAIPLQRAPRPREWRAAGGACVLCLCLSAV